MMTPMRADAPHMPSSASSARGHTPLSAQALRGWGVRLKPYPHPIEHFGVRWTPKCSIYGYTPICCLVSTFRAPPGGCPISAPPKFVNISAASFFPVQKNGRS